MSWASPAFVPISVLLSYSTLIDEQQYQEPWTTMSEHRLWRELTLCILSSNTLFETAASATKCLEKRGLLRRLRQEPDPRVARTVYRVLASPLFLPTCQDGRLRRYRFPRTKSGQLLGAARLVYVDPDCDGLRGILSRMTSGEEAREYFRSHVPGMGMKEASHFLRNVGFATDLAIIDVHMKRFLQSIAAIPDEVLTSTRRRDYLRLEELVRDIAEANDLSLPLLDLAVWECFRLG